MEFDPATWAETILAFIIGVTFHEWGHAWAATLFGDDTPRLQGRLSINPIDHLDPFGTIYLVATAAFGWMFGWGKPVMTNPSRYKDYRLGVFYVAAAGPFMSFVVTATAAIIERFNLFRLPLTSVGHEILIHVVLVNAVLMLFNLIPVPPLDGSKMFYAILPPPMAEGYSRFMAQLGMFGFIAVIAFGGILLSGPIVNLALLLLGPNYHHE